MGDKDEETSVNVTEHVMNKYEVILHLAKEYSKGSAKCLKRLDLQSDSKFDPSDFETDSCGRMQPKPAVMMELDKIYFGGKDVEGNKIEPRGLTTSEVKSIRQMRSEWKPGEGAFGADQRTQEMAPKFNELSPPDVEPEWKKLAAHFLSGFALLLEVGGILCFIAHAIQECTTNCSSDNLYLGIVLVSVVTLNAIFSYYQDGQAESAMNNLKDTTLSKCKVVRDGGVVITYEDPEMGGKTARSRSSS
jgi:hypothetical protein